MAVSRFPHLFTRSASESVVLDLAKSSKSDPYTECILPIKMYKSADVDALASFSDQKTSAISILFTNIIDELIKKTVFPSLKKLQEVPQEQSKLPPAYVVTKDTQGKMRYINDLDDDSSDDSEEDFRRLPTYTVKRVDICTDSLIKQAAWKGFAKMLDPLKYGREMCPGPVLTQDLISRATNLLKHYAGGASLEKLNTQAIPSYITIPGEGFLSDRLTEAVAIQAFRVAVEKHHFKAEETWQLMVPFRVQVEASKDSVRKKELTELIAKLVEENLSSGKKGLPLHKDMYGSSW